MSTPFETFHAPTPRMSSEPRLDDRAFLAVLVAMLLILLSTLGGLADPADIPSGPATAGAAGAMPLSSATTTPRAGEPS